MSYPGLQSGGGHDKPLAGFSPKFEYLFWAKAHG